VYFYEQGLRLLRPGGRMAYVVTNKWLKAGYAEGLRRLFAEEAWIEFLADFGHAKRFFPDADVFPSVLVARRPNREPAPETFDLAVIPRDEVPGAGLDAAARAASYPARRDRLTAESARRSARCGWPGYATPSPRSPNPPAPPASPRWAMSVPCPRS